VKEKVEKAFTKRFGERPEWIVRAPGRVNLIGEHTDYNDGYVLPMAIDQAIWIALRPVDEAVVNLYSLGFGEEAQMDILDINESTENSSRKGTKTPRRCAPRYSGETTGKRQNLPFFSADINDQGNSWFEYIKGVAWALNKAGYPLSGWEGVMAGDIPIGAGLSSSAALELAAARAFAAAAGFHWDPVKMAQAGQRAENEWVGVNCGIMDQMIAANGRTGHALLIDCRSLDSQLVRIPDDVSIVVMDTNTRRGLVDSAYNERRRQCEEGATFFGVRSLRDVTLERFQSQGDRLDPIIRQRVKHVISENQRVLATVGALNEGEVLTAGRNLNASHASLRDDFEVSSPDLDQIVAAAQEHEGCFGARMTGAGFGGCAVALVAAQEAVDFIDHVEKRYSAASGRKATLTICEAADGASFIK
jgi:galactokinase